jgi:hypothetical protein
MSEFVNKDELLEALYDLKHDLGKYIRLPVAMLPVNVEIDEVISAAKMAIERTRRGPGGDISAAALWERFVSEWHEVAEAFNTYQPLGQAVSRAVSWSARVEHRKESWEREALERDLSAVGEAIQSLIEEVRGDG